MSVLFGTELNEDEYQKTTDIPLDSASTLTWAHKALFAGAVLAAIVAFLRVNKGRSGDDDEKTKA